VTSRPRRVVVLVLDGFGVGEMPDRPDEDAGSHTLRHVVERSGVRLPTLCSLRLSSIGGVAGLEALEVVGAFGASNLGYPGADTYMGHQELAGTHLAPELRLLETFRDAVVSALEAEGHTTRAPVAGASPIVVDGCVLVADNVEARPGLNVNVTASLDEIAFDDLLALGKAVRDVVPVPRVIVVAGRGFGIDDILAHLVERAPGQIGVDTPAVGVYDEHYRVQHLGIGVDVARQVPSLVRAAGHDVVLLGKAADVIACVGAELDNVVPTAGVLERLRSSLATMRSGLVVANVQETDLAGHEQDPERYAAVLSEVDEALPAVLGSLRDDDRLFVVADHGNDPCIGHSQHTRERVPVLVGGPGVRPVPLGIRDSLADVGATIAELFGVQAPPVGTSFAGDL
jgi:phosphopentomutase